VTRGPFRLVSGGRIDRGARVNFSLDGRRFSGFKGDTLASALLANGVSVVGRSFKYHRPRGFLSAGAEEPNGLFTLGKGGYTEPNVPGTTTELIEGLTARSQNGTPSVNLDIRSLYGLASPLLAAGFYYKTFIGPRRGSWMFYEPFIRRAAGLGRGVHEADPDRYETRHAFADVLVVGAGPAGLSAALGAGRAGARVVLAEQDSLLGGSLLFESPAGGAENWRRQLESELESLPRVEIRRSTTAFGVYDGGTVALIERRDHLKPDPSRGEARQVVTILRARAIVFATGATERPLVFPNNDRPGVMLASAVRSYLNRFAVGCGRRAVVVTNNDSAYATAFDLAERGIHVSIADTRRLVPSELVGRARSQGIGHFTGAVARKANGGRVVKGLEVMVDHDIRALECDLLAVSGGWSPAVHLTSHNGVAPRYREDIFAFVPGGFASGHFGAGALMGDFTLEGGIAVGFAAGRSAAATTGHDRPTGEPPAAPQIGVADCTIQSHWPSPDGIRGKAFVDFQNDVTVKDVVVAHQEGYQSVEHLKRYTTLGMGTDQGKTSNINALALISSLREVGIPVAGTTTFRPPFTPVAIGALAGRAIGQHFRPVRRSPLHDWHLAHGATMVEAGQWMRPWYYSWAGTTAESAYIEEMRLVRNAVGISDVSTLGKIDVQGPDAAEFLNRLYVNKFARLPIGKARYGVMLNDDGVVLDDGTTTRLAEARFFMTTTTAQAGEVMSWLEFLLQTAWTGLRVHVSSITDEWAAMAISGPKARAALERALPGQDLCDRRLPYMGSLETDLDGVPLRLIRLSFSGELAYEAYVPADFGVALWEKFLAAGESLGMKPYGLEALAALRIEKGHVAGLELDHRNTLNDLGLSKMAATDKPFIGQILGQRPRLRSSERWSLVGIECLEPGKRLRGGSILFAPTDKLEGHGRGHITSVTWSTVLEKFIALGLYQGGLRHAGEEIMCAFPLKGEKTRARIVSPVFLDPQGERLRV